MHAGAAVADRDRAVVTPVDLGALAGSEVQGEEGRGHAPDARVARQIHSDFGHQLSALDDGPAAVVGVLAGVGPPDVAAIVRPIGVPLDSGAGHGVIRA